MNVFLISDTHFRHTNIIHMGDGRPYSDIDEHDEMLIKNWNSVVSDDDIVIHLGDSVMGTRAESLKVIDRLNGKIVLVPGNHDYVSEAESPARREKFRPIYEEYFEFIAPDTVNLGDVVLSHYPPAEIPDHGEEDRYPHLRPEMNNGTKVFLHGHTHQAHRVTNLTDGSVAVSVGVDANNWTPVNIEDIPELDAHMRLDILAALSNI